MHAIQKLSVIQYDAIMQAIDLYKNTLKTDGIDEYSNTENYTVESLLKAVDEVEDIIIQSNIPF